MDQFIEKHGAVIHGALSCFDRMLFRGYLPMMSGAAMADFLQANGVDRWGLKTFLLTQAARLKKQAMEMAAAAGRPYQYLGERTRKEDLARQIAERDRIDEGLVCVFALLELSRTFSVVWKDGGSFVQSTRRKCLQLYCYFMDRDLGLIHVKLQTWFPFQMQIYLNGHEWLTRKLDRRGVKYLKVDNAFVGLSNPERAQQISDQFPSVDWVRVLGRYAADQSTARRAPATDGILLGDGTGRLFDGYPLPQALGPPRADAPVARVQHALLRGQRRDELPRPEAGGPISRRSGHRPSRE